MEPRNNSNNFDMGMGMKLAIDCVNTGFEYTNKGITYLSRTYQKVKYTIAHKLEDHLSYGVASSFMRVYDVTPLALAIFATYTSLSMPALLICGGAMAAAFALTQGNIISKSKVDFVFDASLLAILLATTVKVIGVIVGGATFSSLAAPIVGGLAIIPIYIYSKHNSPIPHP